MLTWTLNTSAVTAQYTSCAFTVHLRILCTLTVYLRVLPLGKGTSGNETMVRGEVVLLGVGLLLRFLLLWLGSQEWLGRRIEISTPVNQWMRSTYITVLDLIAHHVMRVYIAVEAQTRSQIIKYARYS